MLSFLFFLLYLLLVIPLIRSIYLRQNWRKWLWVTIIGYLALSFFLYGIKVYIDALWFVQFDLLSRFFKVFVTQWALFILGFLVSFVVLIFVTRDLPKLVRWIVTGFTALIFGLIAQPLWLTFLKFLNRVQVGLSDPIFHKDIGFYIFNLPFQIFLLNWFIGLFLVSIVIIFCVRYLHITVMF